jgi:hypothetical protein
MAAQMTARARGFGRNGAAITASKPATMSPGLAHLIVQLTGLYLVGGLMFAVPFVAVGIERIDPSGAGSPIFFRILIAPGVVVFWPLLLLRWAAGSVAPPIEINAHRRAAR